MNGGVLHAVESLSPDELAAGVNGYRYFGLDDAASILEGMARRARHHLHDDAADCQEVETDERHAVVVPDDAILMAAFEARYEALRDQPGTAGSDARDGVSLAQGVGSSGEEDP
jgi:hypothetical protein